MFAVDDIARQRSPCRSVLFNATHGVHEENNISHAASHVFCGEIAPKQNMVQNPQNECIQPAAQREVELISKQYLSILLLLS
jgi:hypothetical protein